MKFLNLTQDNPVQAKVLKIDGPRYKRAVLEQTFDALPDDARQQIEKKQTKEGAGEYGHVSYNVEAKAPAHKLVELLDISVEFKKTWDRKRDRWFPSASEYDWSLVTQCAQAGWTDQEIVDTLVHWRRRHDENPQKISRPDLLAKVVDKAALVREEAQVEAIKQGELEEFKEAQETIASVTDCAEEAVREKIPTILDALSKLLKMKITGMDKYLEEPPSYILHTERGSLPLPNIDHIMEQKKFRARVAETISLAPPTIRAKRNDPDSGWDNVVNALLSIERKIEMPKEHTTIGSLVESIQGFIDSTPQEDDYNVVMSNNRPYFDTASGRYWISVTGLHSYAARRGGKETKNELARLLRTAGAESKKVSWKDGAQQRQSRVWVLPPGFLQLNDN